MIPIGAYFISVLALLSSQAPKDPASLGYELLSEPSPVHGSAYGDLPTTAEEEVWLKKSKDDIGQTYGPLANYTTDISLEAVKANLQRVASTVHASHTFSTHNGELMRQSLDKEFLRMEDELLHLNGNTIPIEFGARLDSTKATPGGLFEADVIYFVGSESQVIPRTTIRKNGVALNTYYATPDQALEFTEAAGRIFAIASEVRGKTLQLLGTRLGELNSAWDNYLIHGFSQFPWESYVNGYVTPRWFGRPSWYDPPKDQLIFLHPEVGVLADFRRRSNADVQTSLFVDAIGYVHYFGSDRDWFLGVSAAASLSNDNVGLGVGPMCHFGSSGGGSQLPNVSLGLFWHEPGDGRDGFLIGISIDLWRLFDKTGREGVLRSAFPELAH